MKATAEAELAMLKALEVAFTEKELDAMDDIFFGRDWMAHAYSKLYIRREYGTTH